MLKRFILKSSFFVLPFIFLYVSSIFFYDVNGNDLTRMAYLPDLYKAAKKDIYSKNIKSKFFDDFYTDNLKNEYDFLILGDSFSEGNHSFSNQIAKNGYSVLVLNSLNNQNPFERLSILINLDFFKKIKIKNVIVESVERYAVERVLSTDTNKKDLTLLKKSKLIKSVIPNHNFFSNQSLLFGYNSFKYLLFDNVVFNDVVTKTQLSQKMFSHFFGSSLLYLNEDEKRSYFNNNLKRINKFHHKIESFQFKLKLYDINLLILVPPDKYDLYFDYIKNKKNINKPIFFDFMNKIEKKYHFINTKGLLQDKISCGILDLYLYDDTHWTYKSVNTVSNNIISLINNDKY